MKQIFLRENNNHDTYFYGYENAISFDVSHEVTCEGMLFSPQRNETGHFFFKKFKPSKEVLEHCYNYRFHARETCYLIYYFYDSEYEKAFAEYQKLLDGVFLISHGRLVPFDFFEKSP